jgi:DNA-binding LytR/AlgR family response regulator
MTTQHLLVVEDEAPQREALVAMLRDLRPTASIVACEDGLSALEAIEARAPDIAFLDIRLPGLGGLELARTLAGRAEVVFTTAYDEYAVRAFEAGAVDYLLKPVRGERLGQALARAESRRGAASSQLAGLLEELQRGLGERQRVRALRWITASVGDSVKLVPIEDVLYFQAQDKYTRVVTAHDESVIRTPLKELLEGLDPEEFWQVHRSVIVRASAVERLRKDELGRFGLTLRGRPEVLPASQAFQQRFRGM